MNTPVEQSTTLNMKTYRVLTAAAALAATVQMASAGDITGKITLKGTPPPEKPLPLDPMCGKLHPNSKPTTRFYVTGKDAGLADVFVHVTKGLEGKTFPTPDSQVLIDQVDCEYTPYITSAQTNQKIAVRNSDPLLHNVHPTPAVPGNKESNLAQLPKAKDLLFTFPNPEVLLRFKCDVHPWMFAYVGVVDHPFHAVSDADGAFKLAKLPAGTYTIEAFHRKGGKQTKEVKVDESGEVNVTFEFEAK